jgi:hypothetical protein
LTTSPRASSSSATSPMMCNWVPRLLLQLVVNLTPSRRSTSRRSIALAFTVCPVTPPRVSTTRRPDAPALLHLRRAPGRVVSLLDFSSVGCTGSRGAPGHSVSWFDYSVHGHRDFILRSHWLYFSHAVRHDYLSHGNTGSTSSTPRAATTSSSGRITSTTHLD